MVEPWFRHHHGDTTHDFVGCSSHDDDVNLISATFAAKQRILHSVVVVTRIVVVVIQTTTH